MTENKATALSPIQEVRGTLAKMEDQFARALPSNINPQKFLRVAETAIQNNSDLINADRKTLYAACAKAAQDGLLPDGREGALIVYNTKQKDGSWAKQVQWQPMVQGLVKLARNSGEIANIVAEVVYKEDKFQYRIGLDEMPLHEPDWFAENRGEPIGVWAVVILKNGEKVTAVLPKSKVLRIAGKSKNASQYDPQTGSYYDEWWKKTAIKNVLKYAPKSTEMERLDRLMEREDKEEFNFETPAQQTTQTTQTQDFELPYPPSDTPTSTPRKRASKLDSLKQQHQQSEQAPTQPIQQPTPPVQDVEFENYAEEDAF